MIKFLAKPGTSATDSNGKVIVLKRFDVSVNGEVVGEVAQHRASTMQPYADSRLGRETFRTCWEWSSLDNAGDGEFTSRHRALFDMLDYLGIETV